MFEPKTLTEKRLAMAEALINQLLRRELQKAPEGSDEFMEVSNLLDMWAFRGHRYKDDHAKQVIGLILIDEHAATRPWVESVLRANYGMLEVFGMGNYNPDTALPGNDVNRYTDWLRGLENVDDVLSDTRVSSILRDTIAGQAEAIGGVPVLFINTGSFLHMFILAERVTIQSISIDHLPAGWEWQNPPQAWRTETFGYLSNLTKAAFLNHFAIALAADGREILYTPADMSAEDIALACNAAQAVGMEAVRDATQVAAEDHEAQKIELPPADLVEAEVFEAEHNPEDNEIADSGEADAESSKT